MNIILNNRVEEIDREIISITSLLEYKKFSFRMLIVKINGLLISKDNYAESFINDGDKVDIIHLISGG